jgi:signal-transduction protein with cAMP-binding, CBS, and nucleotidyltransferase domain
MQVRNIMKSPVITIEPEQSVRAAAQVMRDHGIGSVIVQHSGQVVGILTERDVLHAAAQTGNLDGASVDQHMTSPVVTASTSWDVTVAATEMTHRQIRHLVVVEQDQPLGVVSLRDVLSVFLPERVHQHEA